MNKMMLMIAITLVILAIVAVPVSAVLPTNSPLPSSTTFNKIWDLFLNLQVQINSLDTKDTDLQNQIDLINSGTSHVVIVKGSAHNLDEVLVPTGYTIAQCDLIPQPGIINMDARAGDPVEDYILFAQIHTRSESTDRWVIHSNSRYKAVDGTPGDLVTLDNLLVYTIICQK